VVILGTDGIRYLPKLARIRASVGVEVHHRKLGEPPVSGESSAASDRGVIAFMISGRGVQANEHNCAVAERRNLAREPIPILPTR